MKRLLITSENTLLKFIDKNKPFEIVFVNIKGKDKMYIVKDGKKKFTVSRQTHTAIRKLKKHRKYKVNYNEFKMIFE